MSDSFEVEYWVAFLLVWGCLLAVPPVIFKTFFAMRDLQSRALSIATRGSAFILFVILGVILLKISLSLAIANVVVGVLAYSAYCFLAASCWLIPKKIVRIFAIIITLLPIGFGYVLGAVGILGVGFVLDDFMRPPTHIEIMKPGLACNISTWGMAASDEGYVVNLYEYLPEVPFVRRKMVSFSVDETVGQPGASCSDALVKYSD